jgi:hypothetical protein
MKTSRRASVAEAGASSPYHNLRLTPNTNLSVNGFWFVNGQLQFYELSNFGQLNMNISQQFLKKN